MQYEKDQLKDAVIEFISIMKENNLGHLHIKNDKFEIELGEKLPPPMPPMPPMQAVQQGMQPPAFPMPPQGQGIPGARGAGEQSGKLIRSPIVGTFYASPAPGKPPYVSVGKPVKIGDVVFIIESMKLMNEVKSDVSGTVAEILVSDGEAVEYDQPILRLE